MQRRSGSSGRNADCASLFQHATSPTTRTTRTRTSSRRVCWCCVRWHSARADALQQVSKQPNDSSVHDFIAADIAKHPVLVYMKGTPTAPQCGFSNIVCKVLDSHGPARRTPFALQALTRAPRLRAQACSTRAATSCKMPRCGKASRLSRACACSTRAPFAACELTPSWRTGAATGPPFRRCSFPVSLLAAPTSSWACTPAASWQSSWESSSRNRVS